MKLEDFLTYPWEDADSEVSPELVPAVLARLGLEKEGLFPSTSLQELLQALKSGAWRVRLSVVRTLRSLEPAPEIDEMLLKALGDKNKYVRMTAAHALAYHQKKRESLKSAPVDEDTEVSRLAFEMRARIGGIEETDAVALLVCMVCIYKERGHHKKAEEYYKRILLAYEQEPESHPISVYHISDKYARLLREMHKDRGADRLEAKMEDERGPPALSED